MADLQSALHARLSAAIGNSRVYWGIAPQKAQLPYVRLNTISDPRPQHLKGYDGARPTRVQADVFASTYAEARSVSESIIAALAAPAEVGGIRFGRTKAEGPRDLGEDVRGDGFIHRLSTDLLAEHSLA